MSPLTFTKTGPAAGPMVGLSRSIQQNRGGDASETPPTPIFLSHIELSLPPKPTTRTRGQSPACQPPLFSCTPRGQAQSCNQIPFLPSGKSIKTSAREKPRKAYFAVAAAAPSTPGSRRGPSFPDKGAHFPCFICKSIMLS